jgi:uncharacterized DUF497 family protein
MKFEWDPDKAESNFKKHGVRFDEAITVFKDPLAVIFDDIKHSEHEFREIIIGRSTIRRMLLVCFIERHKDTIRVLQRARK